jgi:hypothetical protein
MNLEERYVTGAVVSTFTLGTSEHDAHPTAGLAPRVPTETAASARPAWAWFSWSSKSPSATDGWRCPFSRSSLHAQTTVAKSSPLCRVLKWLPEAVAKPVSGPRQGTVLTLPKRASRTVASAAEGQ